MQDSQDIKYQKKQVEKLTKWLDDQEYEHEKSNGFKEADGAQSLRGQEHRFSNMFNLYKRGLYDYSRQVLGKNPDIQKLINRLIEGISTYHQKLSNLNELKH